MDAHTYGTMLPFWRAISTPVLAQSDSARKLSSSLSGGHAQKNSGVEIVFARKSARNDS